MNPAKIKAQVIEELNRAKKDLSRALTQANDYQEGLMKCACSADMALTQSTPLEAIKDVAKALRMYFHLQAGINHQTIEDVEARIANIESKLAEIQSPILKVLFQPPPQSPPSTPIS